MNPEQTRKMLALFEAVREGIITEEQFSELNWLLAQDKVACKYYFEYFTMCGNLKSGKAFEAGGGILPEMSSLIFDSHFWQEMAKEEKTAPILDLSEAPPKELVTDVRWRMQELRKQQIKKPINKPFLVTTLLSIAAAFITIAYLLLSPIFTNVATVKDCINVEFVNNHLFTTGSRLPNHRDFYRLKNGIIEIEFDDGAIVTIEAPAEFRLDSRNRIFLNSGRLYAKVPIEAIGFIVGTPNSKVVDLGTQFGVNVDDNGTSDVHVFEGKTSLSASRNGKAQNSQILTVGEAKRIDTELRIQDIPFEEKKFVRIISSRENLVWKGEKAINLADLVGGGSGLGTGHVDIGIDPATGSFQTPNNTVRQSDNRYVPVDSCAFIDGVFVPNGTPDQVISSTGLLFRNCPITSCSYYADIVNSPSPADKQARLQGNLELPGRVNSSTARSPFIFLHPNLGITFDVEAFRSCLPAAQIALFSTQVAMSDVPAQRSAATLWILVDGQVRYSKEFTSEMPAELIRIPLDPMDRFLTLMTTEQVNAGLHSEGISAGFKGCLFGNPVLLLE
ncbi:MAG TPA: FecR family protein [Anaerohalosphaeraceae bacterium]|nr:FecR family protein [Anaerohalosphaeraceae bacterium]